ncbi:MAG: polyprenol monophosphomannose synthase [Actinomycetota bacterium]|nr:polyprenol monophosphomannose synthase [Actinomycetota bacterium]MDA3012028.1 polyprenol monophosphomannose synthase [Actinomycetota bacterium]MDA3024734.1 polyprenol monophosphomannose synthase [Actinomycetota bacterium]
MPVAVVLPTYNEAENIDRLLRELRSIVPEARLLVVDDASPDGTGRLAEACAAELGSIDVVHRAVKDGLGNAYRFAFERVIGEGFDVVVTMDSDFSHDPQVIPRMLDAIESGSDVVVGSRYVPGGGTRDWPLHRRLLSRWGNVYTGWILGVGVRDCTSGFRAYRASALAAIHPETTRADGYAFLTELMVRSVRQGARVVEVAIVFVDRRYGTSKMSSRIVLESMLLVTRWGLGHRWRRVTARFGS